MKKVTIQAYEDVSRTEGGHAVVLLVGLARPDKDFGFRIRPVDHRSADGSGGWIGGEHRPVATSATEQGLEFVAGPSITESEHLLPGTVVEIEVSSLGIRGEVLWPNVAPLMRPRRKSIVVNRPRPVVTRTDVASEPSVGAPKAGLSDRPPTGQPEPMALEKSAGKPEPSMPAAPQVKPNGLGTHLPDAASAEVAAEIGETRHAIQARSGAGPDPDSAVEAPKLPEPVVDLGFISFAPAPAPAEHAPHLTPEDIANQHSWAFRKDVGVMLSKKFFALGESRHDGAQEEAVQAAQAAPHHHSIAAEATAILAHHEHAHHEEFGHTDHSTANPAVTFEESAHMEQSHSSQTHAHAGNETFYRHARGSVIAPAHHGPRPAPEARRSVSAGLAAGLATLAIGAIAGATLLSGPPSIGAGDIGATATIPAAGAAAVTRTAEGASADSLLFEALSVGTTSPRGTDASGISAAKALENANVQLLATGAARDTEEGAFWLKQYISSTLSDERTVRALTQLGSVYAEPTGRAPDYAKARLLWEIAGAAGDPVAMCFLGLLHESGLGVAPSKRSALEWYERSKAKGGCPNIDESLTRVSQ